MVKNKASEVYGSFYLCGNEFAVSAAHIQEVVNPPESFTAMPMAPTYMMGLFNLRGDIIPVLDLKPLMHLEGNGAALRKIAVLEHEGLLLGVLFEETAGIFRAREEELSEISLPAGTSLLKALHKMNNGQRLVQILSPEALLALQGGGSSDRKRSAQKGKKLQCISFGVSTSVCAIPIESVQEILQTTELNPAVLESDNCLGTLNLRGTIIPVLDFGSLLKLRPKLEKRLVDEEDRKVLVMKVCGCTVGMLVDSVSSIVSYFPEELLPYPHLAIRDPDLILGCLSGKGLGDVLLLNPSKFLTADEIKEVSRAYAGLYKAQNQMLQKQKSQRQTFISFHLGGPYAVAIEEVREIIERPADLMRPPNTAPHILGVLNLREKLVVIVDMRALYGLGKIEQLEGKVLIFDSQAGAFGLLVDSVGSIVTLDMQERRQLPAGLIKNELGRMGSDIREAVQVVQGSETKHFLILDSRSIATKIA